MFSVTVNQHVVEFEREALTGMDREEQVHLIPGVVLIMSINLALKKLSFEPTWAI